MNESLYSRRSNLVIGFHGCDQSVVEAVLAGKTELLASTNDYDWLGNGIYFWENNEERAWQWAKDLAKRRNSQIKEPAVVGAPVGGPEHIRKTVAEAVGQHGGLAAQAHNVGHRGHDGHGDGGLAGRAVDEEIDEALKYQHTDGGKHRV